MTKEQIKAALDRVLTWPAERQEEVARMIASIEEQDATHTASATSRSPRCAGGAPKAIPRP